MGYHCNRMWNNCLRESCKSEIEIETILWPDLHSLDVIVDLINTSPIDILFIFLLRLVNFTSPSPKTQNPKKRWKYSGTKRKLHWDPKFLQTWSFIHCLKNFGDFKNLLFVSTSSVRLFGPIILIYWRGNFVSHHFLIL